MASVKFFTGWSREGGSTLHHIWLVNKLNEMGHDATLWGPHPWHTAHCPGGLIPHAQVFQNDTCVAHYVNVASVAKARPLHLVASCHESPMLNPLKDQDLSEVDGVHFVGAGQKTAHDLSIESTIIPPAVASVDWNGGPGTGTAGVIGSIDSNKHPAQAIRTALENGARRVLLYGRLNDVEYYKAHVLPFIVEGVAEHRQHASREEVYNSVDMVCSASRSETFGMVEAECKKAGIPFYGASYAPQVEDDEVILQKWVELLNL